MCSFHLYAGPFCTVVIRETVSLRGNFRVPHWTYPMWRYLQSKQWSKKNYRGCTLVPEFRKPSLLQRSSTIKTSSASNIYPQRTHGSIAGFKQFSKSTLSKRNSVISESVYGVKKEIITENSYITDTNCMPSIIDLQFIMKETLEGK